MALRSLRPSDSVANLRRTSLLMLILSATLILVAFAVSSTVLATSDTSRILVSNLNRQISLWESIADALLYTPPQSTSESTRRFLQTSLRSRVAMQLDDVAALEAELRALLEGNGTGQALLNWLRPQELDPDAIIVDRDLLHNVERYIDAPDSILTLGVSTWDNNLQVLLQSGAFNDPLRVAAAQLTENSARIHAADMRFSRIVAAVLIVLLGLFWILVLQPAIRGIEDNRRRLERRNLQLKMSETRLAAALDAFNDYVCEIETDGRVSFRNEPFTTLFTSAGTDPDEVPHLTLLLADLFDDLSLPLPAPELPVPEILDPLLRMEVVEFKGVHLSFRLSRSGPDSWLLVAYDITAQIEQRNKRLHTARLEVIGRLVSGVAHDFNNILASIIGQAELAQFVPDTDPNKSFEQIIENCERGRTLTSLLLSYGREQRMHFRSYPVRSLLPDSLTNISPPAHIELKLDIRSDAWVSVDKNFFSNALQNILTNAFEALAGKPGKVAIEVHDKRQDDTDFVCIDVNDEGPGFTEEGLQNAAEPFYSTKYDMHGTGLGMAMVSGFADQSGGMLRFRNRERGAQVTLVLPALEPASDVFPTAKRKPVPAPAAPAPAPRTEYLADLCIVVEDNATVGKVMVKMLNHSVRETRWFKERRTALAYLEKGARPDIAILDWSLPDGTSEDVMRLLAARSPRTRQILVSGYAPEEVTRLSEEFNITIMSKPVSLKALHAEIFNRDKASIERDHPGFLYRAPKESA